MKEIRAKLVEPAKVFDIHDLPSVISRDRDITSFDDAAASAMAAIRPSLNRLSIQSSDGQNGQQISRQTMDAYRDRSNALFERFSTETGISFDESHMPLADFSDWFLRLKFQISPSSWRSYRSAILFAFSRLAGDEPIIAAGLISSVAEEEKPEKDISRVIKHIPFDDFEKILWECHRTSSDATTELSHFMRAAIRCGLRPIEWAFSEIRFIRDDKAPFGRQAWLFVCNAKASNGRANGPVRAINLSSVEDRFIDPIVETVKTAHLSFEINGTVDTWIGRMRRLMRYYCEKTSTPHYTPYVLRHQAIANWKSIYSAAQVAALAGHAVPETATTHYGRQRDAWGSGRLKNFLVLPSEMNVARVEARMPKDSVKIVKTDGEDKAPNIDRDFGDQI